LEVTAGKKVVLWRVREMKYLPSALKLLRKETKRRLRRMVLPNTGGPTASGIRCDKSSGAYIVDSIFGQAILLASRDDSSSPTVALSTLELSNNPTYASMSDADHFEYDALFLEDHATSVNWNERRRTVSAGNCLVASLNTTARTTLSVHTGPFILDSGTTISISLDASDFFELRPISPRMIKGIGGSSISATGHDSVIPPCP
jgi:hypothetical protein